jgi:hypothetical protein
MLGSMDSSRASPTSIGHSQQAGIVVLGFQTGRVPPPYPQPCQQRAGSVSGGGTRGGIQRSAPWHRTDKRFSNSADGLGLANCAGPTAHKNNQFVLVLLVLLLYCCCAGLDWTVL